MARFDPSFESVLRHEGGFVDHPRDPGGATNFGISLRYLIRRGDLDRDGLLDGDMDGDGDIDVDDIRALGPDNVKHLYHTGFWSPNRLDEVREQEVATKIFDMCVNMGSRQAWRIVQRACNFFVDLDPLVVDGIVGPATLGAVNSIADLMGPLRDQQAQFYEDLVDARPDLEVFLEGWLNRARA